MFYYFGKVARIETCCYVFPLFIAKSTDIIPSIYFSRDTVQMFLKIYRRREWYSDEIFYLTGFLRLLFIA